MHILNKNYVPGDYFQIEMPTSEAAEFVDSIKETIDLSRTLEHYRHFKRRAERPYQEGISNLPAITAEFVAMANGHSGNTQITLRVVNPSAVPALERIILIFDH